MTIRSLSGLALSILILFPHELSDAQGGIPYIYEKIAGSEFYTHSNEPLEGMMEFSETVFPPYGQYMVEAFMRNNSHKLMDLRSARYRAVDTLGQTHYLNFEEVEANTGERNSSVLKPGNIIIVYCRSPIRNDNIREIFIEFSDGEVTHFVPYRRLGEYVQSPEQHLKDLLSGLMDIFKFRMPKG